MEYNYDSLVIRVNYDIDSVLELELLERINEHGKLRIVFRCEKEKAGELIRQSSSEDMISICEGNDCLFSGILTCIEQRTYKGETRLFTDWKTYTVKLDRAAKSRAVTGEDLHFREVTDIILESYNGALSDRNLTDSLIPGFLLQYKETDWEFIRRLAALEDTVLIPDCSSTFPCFSYGLPGWVVQEISDKDGTVRSEICYGEHEEQDRKSPQGAFLQDFFHFTINSASWYALGQPVSYGNVDGIIEEICIHGINGHVDKEYKIVPKDGVHKAVKYNEHFAGLHLAATVSEVTGTGIRADFEIEQIKGGSERWFSYAVESSAWYCMPEVGSSVHIYLPQNDETKAYAVHSMRNTKEGAQHAKASSNPEVKSYTHPSGSAMQLDSGHLLLTADGTGNTEASLGSDGTMRLKAKKIVIRSAGNVTIGKGDIPSEKVQISSGIDISVMSGLGAYAYLGEQAFLKGGEVFQSAALHDNVEIPAQILARNNGIEEKIAEVNAAAKQMQVQKVKEAKQKTGMGIFAMVAGAVAITAVCVCTCGAGVVAVGLIAGGTALACGAGMATEGVQDYQKAVESGDYSQSFNFIRDTVFQGNQTLYDIVTYGSVLVCGIITAVATGGGSLQVLKETLLRSGTEMAIDGAMNLIGDYIDDGSINNGWESYFKSMCMTGSTAGFSQGAMNQFKKLEDAQKFSCSQLGKMRLGVDMAIDSLSSYATTGEVDFAKLFLQNYISNKLTLSDPVDAATGSLYIPAVDMRLPDIGDDYEVSRKYESVNTRTGLLGKGWTSSLESLLQYRGDKCNILCTDGHVESFHFKAGVWCNDKGSSLRMTLSEENDSWILHDAVNFKTYHYDRSGRLTAIGDRHGNQSIYSYKDGILESITTFAGGRIQVTIEGGRLRAVTDMLGRTVTYTYEGEYLVCVNQHGRGLTRYTYDSKGHITDITDQNNKKYTINSYDDRGRVTGQDYPDGTCCRISYDDIQHSATFYYPETGGMEKAYHNLQNLVTRMEYQDGTYEEFGYDEWQNRIYEKDRNGGVTTWEYSVRGEKLKETLPDGLETAYSYDDNGQLTEQKDSEGGCTCYSYDGYGNITSRKTLLSEQDHKWGEEHYGHDKYGRLLYVEDANGNRTAYYYEQEHPQQLEGSDFRPSAEISPEGYEFYHTYDAAGRKLKTSCGRSVMYYGYNTLNRVTGITDGEGNISHEEYDNLGSLLSHYNGRQWDNGGCGNGYSYEYDHFDRLIKVKDPLGRVKRYIRNGQGSIVSESALAYVCVPKKDDIPQIKNTYDANENRTKAVCPDGGEWETVYDAMGNLLFEKGPEGTGARSYKYDSMNRVVGITREDGLTEKSFVYDRKGNCIEETDALGYKTYHSYDEAGRRTGTWEYAAGTDEAGSSYRVTQYIYDAAGNIIEERRGMDAVMPHEYPHHFLSIQKKYDRQNRLISVEDGTGACISYSYDFMNNCTLERRRIDEDTTREVSYSYDMAGRLTEKEEKFVRKQSKDSSGIQAGTKESVTKYAYDNANNLTSVTLPGGESIRFVYDEADRPVCRMEEDKKNGIRRSMVYLYDDVCAFDSEQLYGRENFTRELNRRLAECSTMEACSSAEFARTLCREQPVQVRYYCGRKALCIYHDYEEAYADITTIDRDRQSRIDAGAEGTDYFTRSYSYDFRGNLISYTDTLGNSQHYTYDKAGRPIGSTDPSGRKYTYAYDAWGNILSGTNAAGETEYSRTYDSMGHILTETDGEGSTFSYTYDPAGNVTSVSGPDGVVDYSAEYDIWGRIVTATDGNGSVTGYRHDKWGRVTGVILPDGGTEHYAYDYAGNVISATDAMGKETRFTYRAAGRVESIRKADGAVKYFGYDAEGRCSYRLDENKNLIRTTYNMDGNPVLMTGSRNASLMDIIQDKPQTAEPEIRSVYTYDERGFLTSASEGGTVYHYTRDSEGRTLTKSAWGKTLHETSYGADGKPSSIVAQGVRTDYTYDDAGRLKKLVSDNGLSVQYCYDRNGMQTQMLYGNGLITSYTYDSRSRLTGMQSCFKDRTPLFSASYTYDAAGNRTGRQENVLRNHGTHESSITTIYGYDNMNRLVAENCGDSRISYKYDLSGNRISQVTDGRTETYLYNSRNQLTQLTGDNKHTSYTYDPAGNLVEEHSADHKRIYSYDTYNRNTEITGNDFTQKNHYDAEGYRYSLEENEKVTNFVYRGGIMLAELDEAKNPTKSYVPGNEYAGHVSELNNSLTSENKAASYFITDEQGSIRYILDQSGEVLNFYQYSAFGETVTAEESIPSRLRYNAQTEDELTGLYYLRARYYSPNIGRFTQEDVIYNDGLNLYAYCDSNPVMYCDPSGFALSPSDERAITLTMEASRDPELVQAAKDGNIELLKKKHALADTSGDFDGLVILKGNTPRDKKAMEILNLNGLDGIYYKSGKPEFGPVSLFQVNIPNMGVNRGKIGQFFDGTGSNYGQYKQGVAEAIFSAKGDYDKLYKMNIIPPNQTKYTANKAQEFLNDIKRNFSFGDISEIDDIHSALGAYIYNNNHTIHEAFDPLTQSPPGIINAAYNHEGGVAEKGGCKKK